MENFAVICIDNYTHMYYSTNLRAVDGRPYQKCNWTVNALQCLPIAPFLEGYSIVTCEDGDQLPSFPPTLIELKPFGDQVSLSLSLIFR